MSEEYGGTSRRGLLGYAGAAGAGLVGGVVAGRASATAGRADSQDGPQERTGEGLPRTISPYGRNQPGIATHPARACRLVALDLRRKVDAGALGRLMRLWTGDIEAATLGRPAPGDTAPMLAQDNLDLSITVGWGPRVFDQVGIDHAPGLVGVPPMIHDRLTPAFSGGDLLLRVEADDDTTIAHVLRRLLLDAEPFATLRWEQRGSWRGRDAEQRPITGRNLFGQVDGTGNPAPGTALFDHTVWQAEGAWAGGSTLVVRRIKMRMDAWDAITRHEQEAAIGRDLAVGAPLSGTKETDPMDFEATDADGRLLIGLGAHSRLSHPTQNNGLRIFRKGANYVDDVNGVRETGLIFQSFQADIAKQFVPLQTRLDREDDLNTWTVAVGSAEFAILPGFEQGHWLGEPLLT